MATRGKLTSIGEKVVIPARGCSTSVKKTNSVGHVPHEPVKGAVVRQPQMVLGLSATSHGHAAEHQPSSSRVPSRNSSQASLGRAEIPEPVPKIDRLPADGSDALVSDGEPGLAGKRSAAALVSGISANKSNVCLYATELNVDQMHAGIGVDIDSWLSRSLVPASAAALGSATCQTTGELENEIVALKEQLIIQTKVNTDLKKLLVASIGDDLHHKVDALVRTKIQLANEIDDYTKKLLEDYEDLDKLSIQADIWHSKYQASRLLVEQLTLERDKLYSVTSDLRGSLQLILQEHHDIQQLLLLTRRNLDSLQCKSSEGVINTESSPCAAVGRRNCIDLAMCNKRSTDEMCLAAYGKLITHSAPGHTARCSPTPAETTAHKLLSETNRILCSEECETMSGGGVHALMSGLQPRFQPFTRYDGVTFNCCGHCKGEVHQL